MYEKNSLKYYLLPINNLCANNIEEAKYFSNLLINTTISKSYFK